MSAQAEIHNEARRAEPVRDLEKEEYDIALATAGIGKELQSMKDINTSGDNERYLSEEFPTMWRKRPKCTDTLSTSLSWAVQGNHRQGQDLR